MHREQCGGIWCLSVDQTRVTCGRCQVTTRVEWLYAIDREALEQLVDPDGLQRAFLAATGLPPRPRPLTAYDDGTATGHLFSTRRHPSTGSAGADTKHTFTRFPS